MFEGAADSESATAKPSPSGPSLKTRRSFLGVLLGLLLGKPIGITLFARLASVVGLGSRPTAVTWSQIFGASWLCGIGFTMSLFIAGLALGDGDLLDMSKIGTLAASIAAGCVGSILLLKSSKTLAAAKA